MTNMTLLIPEDLHELMRKHSEVKWTQVARNAIRQKAQQLEVLDKLLKGSKLTEKDSEILGKRLRKNIGKRHR